MYILSLEVVSAALQIYCMTHNHDPYGNCQLRRKKQPIVKIDSYHYCICNCCLPVIAEIAHFTFHYVFNFLHRSISIACALFISTFSANHAFHNRLQRIFIIGSNGKHALPVKNINFMESTSHNIIITPDKPDTKLMHDSYKYRITTDNIIVRLLNCTSLHSAFHCEKFSSCFWSFEDMDSALRKCYQHDLDWTLLPEKLFRVRLILFLSIMNRVSIYI